MVLNSVIIIITLIYMAALFYRDYYKGLYTSIFLFILLPVNLSIEISVLIPAITIHRALLMLMFLVWLNNRNTSLRTYFQSPIWLVMTLLVCSMGISLLLADSLIISLKQYLFFFTESFLFFVIVFTSLKNVEQAKKMIIYATASLMVTAIIGIIKKYTGYNVIDIFGQKMNYDLGVTTGPDPRQINSTFPHRILFGIALAFGMQYYFYLHETIYKNRNLVIKFLPIMVFASALYFSGSRGPWLAFAIAFSFTTVMNPKSYMKKAILLLFVVMFVFALRPGTYMTIAQLFESTVDSTTIKGGSFRWRFSVIEIAVNRTLSADLPHVLFGFGHGSHFTAETEYVQLSTGHVAEMLSWDCEYAVNFFEFGVIGMILIAYMYTKLSILSIRYMLRHPRDRLLVSIVFSVLLIVMFMKTNVRFFSAQLGYVEYMNLAILCFLLGKAKPLSVTEGENTDQ